MLEKREYPIGQPVAGRIDGAGPDRTTWSSTGRNPK